MAFWGIITVCLAHNISITDTNRLMAFWGIITVCFDKDTKQVRALCGHNAEYLFVKASGM